MDVLSKIISMILVVILICLLPLQYLLGHQLTLFDDYVEDKVVQLVDDMREKKYLDVGMYEEFQKKLNITDMLYEIEIEHAVPKEGTDLTAIEDIPGVLVASSNLSSIPRTSAVSDNSIESTSEIYSLAAHTHTDACYAGHRHTSSCEILQGDMTKAVNVNYSDTTDYMGKSISVGISCNTCSKALYYIGYMDYNAQMEEYREGYAINIDLIYISSWAFNESGQVTTSAIRYYKYLDSPTWLPDYYSYGSRYRKDNPQWNSWLTDLNNLVTYVKSTVPMTYPPDTKYYSGVVNSFRYNNLPIIGQYKGCPYCGTSVGYICGLVQDENPICDQVVTSISATAPTQTVDKGGSIITTATATYLDGHTGTVNCTSNFNPNLEGVQTVTLTYSGLVGNAKTTGTRASTLNATVRVSNIPSYLTVTPSVTTIYNGSEPSYIVKVTYTGGNTKTLTSGEYSKTGWATGAGIKSVNFCYTENGKYVSASVIINVLPNITNITITPTQQEVPRYTDPSFQVTAAYDDGTSKNVYSYTLSGFNKNVIGSQTVTISYTEASVTKSGNVSVRVTPMSRICPVCGNEYYLDGNDFDQGCPVCKTKVSYIYVSPEYLELHQYEPLNIVVTASFLDGHTETITGWSSNFIPGKAGNQLVMVTYQGIYAYVSVTVSEDKTCSVCGTVYGLNDDGTDPGCPICKDNVVSISATPGIQTVRQGNDMNLIVTATYRDGHSAVISDWGSSFDKNKAGEQKVVIYYRNLSCSLIVNVTSENEVQCPVCGTIYDVMKNPWGCPVCAGTLTGIEATLLTGGTRIPYGKDIDLRVILIYRDDHRVMAFDGWTDNFDPYVMGAQIVTISYTDQFGNTVSCVLPVEVVDGLTETVCANGHVYYASNPDTGCPFCAAINGKGVGQYYECCYTDKVLDELYTNGVYYFNKGDYITVKVKLHVKGSIYSFGLFRKMEGIPPVTYGGEVA